MKKKLERRLIAIGAEQPKPSIKFRRKESFICSALYESKVRWDGTVKPNGRRSFNLQKFKNARIFWAEQMRLKKKN